MDQQLRRLEVLAAAGRTETLLRASGTPGLIYSFVPAHGESRVGAVQQQLNRIWTEDLGLNVLPADFDRANVRTLRTVVWNLSEHLRHAHGARNLDSETGCLLDFARHRYDIVSVDLTGAREDDATAVIKESTSLFLVSSSDEASVATVCDKIAWLRSLRLEGNAGVLLYRVPGGLSTAAIEDVTGLPVCGLVDSTALVRSVAIWLGAEREFRLAEAV